MTPADRLRKATARRHQGCTPLVKPLSRRRAGRDPPAAARRDVMESTTVTDPPGPDGLLPPEMARRAEEIGVRKANLDAASTFVLAVLAGAFIALGAVFSTTVVAGTAGVVPYGITRLLAGVVFCLGLVLVVVGGAELFTGNALIVWAWASG
jgi:hypothetical protein